MDYGVFCLNSLTFAGCAFVAQDECLELSNDGRGF
jgi:hypothetical protein